MDFDDTTVINLYLNLVKGDVDTPIKDLRFSQQFIEEKVRSGNNTVFPIDLVLFSRHHNLVWAIEVKDISTTDLSQGQVDAYSNLVTSSFQRTLPSHTELARMRIEVSYQGNDTNAAHISNQLQACSASFPVLALDSELCKLTKHDDRATFTDVNLARIFQDEVDLGIDSMDKLTPYVKFGTGTNHKIVVASVLPVILKMTEKIHRKQRDATRIELSIADVTRDSYCTLDIWGKLDANYKALLIRTVRDALTALHEGGLDELEVIGGDKVSLNIYDINGKINQQILTSIKQKIEGAEPTVGMSQSSML